MNEILNCFFTSKLLNSSTSRLFISPMTYNPLPVFNDLSPTFEDSPEEIERLNYRFNGNKGPAFLFGPEIINSIMFGSVPGFEMTGSGKEKITEIFTDGIYFLFDKAVTENVNNTHGDNRR